MASRVAWLNFDAEQQRRTQLVMLALAEQSTVDELGLGTVRDLIAGALHPNMTVLFTRARYIVFVPRVYSALTSRTTDRLLAEGRRAETRITRQLVAHYGEASGEDDTGIIGRRRLESTKNLASAIYWPLLRALGVVTIPGSVTDYCRHRAEVLSSQHARTLLHSDDDVEPTADDAWIELPGDADAPVSFDLTPDEAEWVRQRFVQTEEQRPQGERSLVAWLLDADRYEWVPDVRRVWDHPAQASFPADTAEVMYLGRDLDRLVHGARILYNWLCAREVPEGVRREQLLERYDAAMDAWVDEIDELGLPTLGRLDELHGWIERRLAGNGASPRAQIRWQTTYRFLRLWQQRVDSGANPLGSATAARLITEREATLKPGRARLQDRSLLTDWQGDSGYGRFDYNWTITRRILTDIHRGLGTDFVGMVSDR